ncbi:hypothetical protein [Lignipirellula cremea]|uniref:Uncharacterized protein n=1 Tax=Lignipirellula cremea TaxID=2528010 RepID=A0A518E001_9BACT|nr:hypothetical protein [Lignipirellula cremea]QDU97405.1 hypothetical protein Pla8534_52510 [Lignipirellula cremea]
MPTQKDILAAIATDPDLCDLGYEYAELDRRGYCLWVIDCAQHLFPLAQRHLTDSEMAQLTSALNCGRQFLDGAADVAAITDAIAVPRSIANSYCESNGEIVQHLAETLEAIANSLELTMPDSKVYHEDVIYAAARAAFDGELHAADSADTPEESDCNDLDELVGSEESDKEMQWQLQALKTRLLETGT